MLSAKSMMLWRSLLFVILIQGLFTGVGYAANNLPERKSPVADDGGKDDTGGPPGAYIEATAGPPGAASVVQWQDKNGDWQDVDGWRGSLDNRGTRRWWVAAKDFGTGPFRWVVGDSVSPAGVSEPFNLPKTGATTLLIRLAAE